MTQGHINLFADIENVCLRLGIYIRATDNVSSKKQFYSKLLIGPTGRKERMVTRTMLRRTKVIGLRHQKLIEHHGTLNQSQSQPKMDQAKRYAVLSYLTNVILIDRV
jgi:hypothetical protein